MRIIGGELGGRKINPPGKMPNTRPTTDIAKEGLFNIIENNLDVLEQQLSPETFFRVNRQFIVNYTSVKEVIAWFDGKLKLIIKPDPFEEIIISRLKAGDFKNWLNK